MFVGETSLPTPTRLDPRAARCLLCTASPKLRLRPGFLQLKTSQWVLAHVSESRAKGWHIAVFVRSGLGMGHAKPFHRHAALPLPSAAHSEPADPAALRNPMARATQPGPVRHARHHFGKSRGVLVGTGGPGTGRARRIQRTQGRKRPRTPHDSRCPLSSNGKPTPRHIISLGRHLRARSAILDAEGRVGPPRQDRAAAAAPRHRAAADEGGAAADEEGAATDERGATADEGGEGGGPADDGGEGGATADDGGAADEATAPATVTAAPEALAATAAEGTASQALAATEEWAADSERSEPVDCPLAEVGVAAADVGAGAGGGAAAPAQVAAADAVASAAEETAAPPVRHRAMCVRERCSVASPPTAAYRFFWRSAFRIVSRDSARPDSDLS